MPEKNHVNSKKPLKKSSSKKKDTLIQRKQTTRNQSYVPELNSLIPCDMLFLQGTIGNQAVNELLNSQKPIQKKKNNTGLPDTLKDGIEHLSGLSMDDVRVHLNSPKPDTLHALAYTQGRDIYVGPGQEKHMAHEAWHVVQQKQGRVHPTGIVAGLPLNDSRTLEAEADSMAQNALQIKTGGEKVKENKSETGTHNVFQKKTIQGVFTYKGKTYNKDNADSFKKTFHQVKANDVKDLAKSDTNYGTLDIKDDFVQAIQIMRQAPPPVAQNTTAALYNFGDKSQVLIRDTANNLIIGIDTHQNKHQHPNALIPQLGTWIRKKGSTFAKGKGLEWHRNNTAKTMQTWAKANLPIAQQIYLQKQPLSDGYIYDATLFMDLGVAVVTYHCNPPKNE